MADRSILPRPMIFVYALASVLDEQIGPSDEGFDRIWVKFKLLDFARGNAFDAAFALADISLEMEVMSPVCLQAYGIKGFGGDCVWADKASKRDEAMLLVKAWLVDQPIEMGRAIGEGVFEKDSAVHMIIVSCDRRAIGWCSREIDAKMFIKMFPTQPDWRARI